MVLANIVLPSPVLNEYGNTTVSMFPKDAVLAGTRQVALNGVLGQIIQLAEYSNELFGEILKDAQDIANRCARISSRIENISARLPEMDNYFANHNYDVLCTRGRVEFHSAFNQSSQLMTIISKAPSIQTAYNNAAPPPKFELVDDECGKMYSNPNYFIDEWMADMEKQRVKAKEKRKERRKAREEARAKAGLAKKNGNDAKVEARTIARTRYDPHTGQRIADTSTTQLPLTHTNSQSSFATPPASLTHTTSASNVSLPRQRSDSSNNITAAATTPAKAATMRHPGTSAAPPPPANVKPAAPPPQVAPVATAKSSFSAPPSMTPPPSLNATPRGQTAAPARAAAPALSLAPPPPAFAAPPPPPAAPAPPPPPAAPAPPPAPGPPPPPSALGGGGGGGGGFAAALLSKGQALKAAPEKPAAANSSSDLLQQIRAGMNLSKAAPVATPGEKQEEAAGASVAAILARRIAIADSDDEDDDESDEWSD